MNAVRAPGPGDSHDVERERSERNDEALVIEYRRILAERLGDADCFDQALGDAMNEYELKRLAPSDYGYATESGIDAFGIEKAQSVLMRKQILELTMTGKDDAELGRLIRKASSWAFAREALRLAVQEVSESRRYK